MIFFSAGLNVLAGNLDICVFNLPSVSQLSTNAIQSFIPSYTADCKSSLVKNLKLLPCSYPLEEALLNSSDNKF